MKSPCDKCGKTIGFFDRSYKIENERLNIKYENLCGECHGIVKNGAEKVEEMYQWMMHNLKKNKDIQKNGMVSVEIDLLILLAVEALFSVEPNYYLSETPLNQTIIMVSENRGIDKQKDIVRIVYKLLLYGFQGNLKEKELETSRNFMAYMINNEVFLEEVEVNCSIEEELVTANVLISRRGLIIQAEKLNKLIYIPISADTIVDYEVEVTGIINEMSLKNIYYSHNNKKNIILTLKSEKMMLSIANAIDRFNKKTERLQNILKKESFEYFNDCVLKDIKKLKPDDFIEAIHLDCLLLCIVKNLKSQEIFSMEELFDPKGTTIEVLWAYYRHNLRNMGIDNNEKLITYLLKNCVYTEGFNIKHGNKPSDKGWGFFTPKGYILFFRRSKQVFFIYTDTFPNGLYNSSEKVCYENKYYLQLIMNSGQSQPTEARELDEIIFFSQDEAIITQMERFFQRHNLYFQMETFVKTQKEIKGKREKHLELRRIINHIFTDYGYLPYCIYDEWYMVQKELKENDLLLEKLIETDHISHENYTLGRTIYAPKIIEAFNQGVEKCQQSLGIKGTSVAKAILWTELNEAVTKTLSEEWVRVAGDILEKEDNTLSAFLRYVNLKNIESDKVYYMGLFIYHLMDRGILPSDNFIDNYEGAVRIFLECRRVIDEPQYEGTILPMDELLEEAFPEKNKRSE